MGGGSYNFDQWTKTKSARSTQSRAQLFSDHAYEAKTEFIPANMKGGIRESRDSIDSPEATPIIVMMDVTGSMGFIPEYMAKQGIGDVMARILKFEPVKNPHVLMGTFADAKGDSYPIQVAQFEADNRIAEQAVQFYLGGGGAGDSESYDYPWFFAAKQVRTDAWDKRGKKGYLFTFGDEPFPHRINTKYELQRHFGAIADRDYTSEEMLELAKERFVVFHVVIEEGSRGRTGETARTWKEAMGPNVLFLDDHTNLAALITATIAFAEGRNMDQIIAEAGDGAKSVERAFRMLAEYA